MSAATAPAELELRVVDGPQRGARCALDFGSAGCLVAIGASSVVLDDAESPDLLLRGCGPEPARLRIVRDEKGQAALDVLQGDISVAGEAASAGQRILWPSGHVLQANGASMAWGDAAAAHWPLVRARPSGAEPERAMGTGASAFPAASRQHAAAPRRRRTEWWVGIGGTALALGSAALMAIAHVTQAAPPDKDAEVAALRQALTASEFSGLELRRDADTGQWHLSGRVPTLAQQSRLQDWLARQRRAALPMPPLLTEVQVDEQLAIDVADVFRTNGVPVQASVQSPGRVAVDASEPDLDKLARAEQVARRDVPGLHGLEVRNGMAAAASPAAAALPPDPGKRIAALVPGDLPYVVTGDGARYFIGALLPSGYRIAGIDGRALTLERDGRRTEMQF